VAVLYHLLQAACGPGDEVVYAWRSFEAYPIAVQLTGATSVRVPLTDQARHDFKAMESALTDRTRRHGVYAEQPDRSGGPPRRTARLPRRGAAQRVVVLTRLIASSSAIPTHP
jgi:hypothetical protein